MPDYSPELIEEMRQVAGLVCSDLDVLFEVSKNESMTLERLRSHVKRTKEKKDKILEDPVARQSRYDAVMALVGCGALGHDPKMDGVKQ